MRRWDGLVDGYTKECEVRGLSAAVVYGIRREMDRCGNWLKRRRPKVDLEKLEATVLMDYLRKRSAFHAKSTLSASLSKLRGMGEYRVGLRRLRRLRRLRSVVVGFRLVATDVACYKPTSI